MHKDIRYSNFIKWLAAKLKTVRVNLDIPRSSRNPTSVYMEINGIESVLESYSWKASWMDKTGRRVDSQSWITTKESIRYLSDNVRSLCSSKESTDKDIMEACQMILAWGGERDANKGASRFLNSLMTDGKLKVYLNDVKEVFRLDSKSGPLMGQVAEMNSMLTKIHAFLADDGLPIYDSRVAAAAASFVEIYSREIEGNFICPRELIFPAVGGGGERRTLTRLFPDCDRPRILRYGQPNTSHEWALAKWHLGRVFRDLLDYDPRLFAIEGDSSARAHALEASFFMIGYDVRCLA